MSQLIEELRRHQEEYNELVHGPLCGEAADEIDRLTKLAQRLIDSWDIVRSGWNYTELHSVLNDARALTSRK